VSLREGIVTILAERQWEGRPGNPVSLLTVLEDIEVLAAAYPNSVLVCDAWQSVLLVEMLNRRRSFRALLVHPTRRQRVAEARVLLAALREGLLRVSRHSQVATDAIAARVLETLDGPVIALQRDVGGGHCDTLSAFLRALPAAVGGLKSGEPVRTGPTNIFQL